MIKILQKLFGMFGKHKKTAQKMMDEHGDKIDQVTDKIPGEMDDKIVDQVREQLKK